jgi:hypothetical protein
MIALAPVAMLALLSQSVTWGIAGAALKRYQRRAELKGITLCHAARSIAGAQIIISLIQVIAFAALPTILVFGESMAWRQLIGQGVAEATAWREKIERVEHFDLWLWAKGVYERSSQSFMNDVVESEREK